MGQTWDSLLFAHWEVDPDELRGVVPAELPLDRHEGRVYLGITPFVVRGLRARGTLPVPVLSSFPELNVRTYVELEGRPGIYFLSLDAASAAAVLAARRAYRLPYFRARMSAEEGEGVGYGHERVSPDGPPASFRATYRPTGPVYNAAPGSLDWFLTERYCLYTLDGRRRVCRADIHHPPWPLQRATAEIAGNTMTAGLGIRLEGEPLLHYAGRQDVVIWRPRHSGG